VRGIAEGPAPAQRATPLPSGAAFDVLDA
jgi:hypothetical protein